MFTLNNCQLEWNQKTGVLYVHNKETGCTVLRIQGLPLAKETAQLLPGQTIDLRADEKYVSVPVDLLR